MAGVFYPKNYAIAKNKQISSPFHHSSDFFAFFDLWFSV